MQAAIFKNIQSFSRKDRTPMDAKKAKSNVEDKISEDEYVIQPTESSDRITSLAYVSSKGFFFQ